MYRYWWDDSVKLFIFEDPDGKQCTIDDRTVPNHLQVKDGKVRQLTDPDDIAAMQRYASHFHPPMYFVPSVGGTPITKANSPLTPAPMAPIYTMGMPQPTGHVPVVSGPPQMIKINKANPQNALKELLDEYENGFAPSVMATIVPIESIESGVICGYKDSMDPFCTNRAEVAINGSCVCAAHSRVTVYSIVEDLLKGKNQTTVQFTRGGRNS